MRWTPLTRWLAAVLAVALPAATAPGAVTGHACAHHEGVGVSESSHVEAGRTAVGAEDPGGPHAHHAALSADDEPAAPGHHSSGSGPCTCVGTCQGSAAAPPPDAAPGVSTPAPGHATSPAPYDVRTARATALPFLLPFANAPPSLA
jgi:hypothetical protein